MNEPAHVSATRRAYDTVAVDYAHLLESSLDEMPFDRVWLSSFAEQVRTADTGRPVCDAGCGPGRITTHLHSLGLDAYGVDLSPAMVAEAARRHPELRFEVGSIAALDISAGALGGLVAWYSIIHTPPALLPAVFAEFARVLAPAGSLLLAFQVGHDQVVRLKQGYGHAIALDAYRHAPESVGAGLRAAGFSVTARMVREPNTREKTRQCYLLASRMPLSRWRIAVADLTDTRVVELLESHVEQLRAISPPGSSHALNLSALRSPEITLWVLRGAHDEVLGCAALKALSSTHGEVKSMRTVPASQGLGVAGALLAHVVAEARALGLNRLSLETGSMDYFAPARRLYARSGFQECGPFGDYCPDPHSTFMRLDLGTH